MASAFVLSSLFHEGLALAAGCTTPSFAVTLSFDSGPNPSSLAIADFNGDGKLDLAVANSTSNSVSVLLGKGAGTFQAAIQYAAGPNPKSVAVSDFNGDGRPDLAVANFGGNSAGSVSVLLGKGDGTFEDAVNSSLGSDSAHPTSVAVGDFNGDGKPDSALALYSDTRLLVLLGRGDGTFQDAVYFGTGAKPAFGWPTPFGQWSVATGDFNGDSKPDLIVTNPGKVGDPFIPGSAIYGSVSVLLGKGDGSFQAPINLDLPAFPYSAVVDDFNGDGKADLAVANYGSISGAPYITGVSLLLGKGDGTFQNPVEYAAGGNPVQVVAGDLNGDGKPDLAVANSASGNVSVLLGKGDGAFQSQVSFGTGWVRNPWLWGISTATISPTLLLQAAAVCCC